MRAKVKVTAVFPSSDKSSEILYFGGVSKNKYDPDGLDEDNTFAKFTPSFHLQMSITNPSLLQTFEVGDVFYVDFVKEDKKEYK